MNQILQEVKLSVLEMNPVAAILSIHFKPSGLKVHAECFEVGVDGSKPDSPLAVAATDLSLRVGTPFLWTKESRPGYALIVLVEQASGVEHWEVRFGFDSVGNIVVTKPLRAISFTPPSTHSDLPTVFVVGDSTAFSNGKNQRGWGDELANFFDPQKINVLNRARPGRSARSFRSEGLWSRVLAEMKHGDIVLIQFGHNDADTLDKGRCRGVLAGIGDETVEVKMPGGRVEVVHTFGWYLRQYVSEAKAKGAFPVLLSPTPVNLWEAGSMNRDQGGFGRWAQDVSMSTGIEFMGVNSIICDRYDLLGPARVQPLFCSTSDNVHTSSDGARVNAALVAFWLKRIGRFGLADALRV